MTELSRSDVAIGVKTSWVYGFLILLLAALIRLAFFRGALGTDEIVYLTQAQRLLNGDIGHAVYIGAVRYGINGFQALSIRLFGNGVAGRGGPLFFFLLGHRPPASLVCFCFFGCRAAISSRGGPPSFHPPR